jgi:hypothetical protein
MGIEFLRGHKERANLPIKIIHERIHPAFPMQAQLLLFLFHEPD